MPTPPSEPLREGIDYYIESGRWVFTASYHLRRGYCCKNRCRHCPYGLSPEKDKKPSPTTPPNHAS